MNNCGVSNLPVRSVNRAWAHPLRMLRNKKGEREIIHAEGSVEKSVSVHEEYDVLDGIFHRVLVLSWRF